MDLAQSPSEKAPSLPKAACRSAGPEGSPSARGIGQLRREQGRLHEHWYAACCADELTALKPLARVLWEEPLVLFRDAERKPVALSDRCTHRGAALSEGQRDAEGCLRCPYHGWAYDGQGQVIQVPSEGPERRVRPGLQGRSFPCQEQDGLVWVWMGDGAPHREPPPMPWRHDGAWRTYYMITDFDNNVTNLVENFLDVPHTVFVHAGWFRNEKQVEGEAIARRGEGWVELEYLHQDAIGFADWALNPDGKPMRHTDRFLFPNTTRVDYAWGEGEGDRAFVISSTISPVGPMRCRVYTAISFKFPLLGPALEPFFRWYTRQVIEQDVVIARNQGANLQRFGEANFRATAADVIHAWVEAWRDWALQGEQGPPPPPAEKRVRFWI